MLEDKPAGRYQYEYPHPAVTVDCAIFGLDEGELKLLLIQRDLEPYAGDWALPGGFVKLDEGLEDAARRELGEETGVTKVFMEQVGAFGEPDRDPRERVITVAWWAIVNLYAHPVKADTDARNAAWFSVDELPALAFDHGTILDAALGKLREKVRREPVAFEFLPRKFPLTQLQRFYETVLGEELDKRNFRKKALSYGILAELEEYEVDVAHRAARLYRFDKAAWSRLRKAGGSFML